MVFIAAVIAALVIGWVAGLLSFKKSEEYCSVHGVTRTCSICVHYGVPSKS